MDVINPLLSVSKTYKRSVGFFSSSSFSFIGEGIVDLARNGGRIYLATSPKLSDEDINAISLGYINRNEFIQDKFIQELKESLNEISDENAKLLEMLISSGILDIKVVLKNGGMYHDKLTLLEDFSNNKIAFVGSPNESGPGYDGEDGNYEKVRIFKSWMDPDGRVEDETLEFDSIWNGTNESLETFSFMDAVKECVVERVEHKGHFKKTGPKYEMRDYQQEAKDNWIKNGHKGFFVMATGTGKTITSLNSIKEFVNDNRIFTVIAVPYKHLVAQWYEDAKEFFPDAFVIMIHGEITDGETRVFSSYLSSLNEYKPIIVITTIKSFFLQKYVNLYKRIKYEKLLIVDEAHNFFNSINPELGKEYPYKLGLSATPVFGKDETKTTVLVNWFGGIVEDFPIEKAIGKYLVNYEYHPIFVQATEKDEKNFSYYTKMMLSAFDGKTGTIIDEEKFAVAYRGRLKAISMAENKMANIVSIFNEIQDKSHTIIYCSDGKMLYSDAKKPQQEEIRHLEVILKLINNAILNKKDNLKASKFTASENIETRLSLIDDFNKERINYLVAIRCLDEGINIPSITSALILSSNDNYREFVQRRGRILRLYKDPVTGQKKDKAHIYDVIVLPSIDNTSFVEIELRRFYEYSRLALNKDELDSKLKDLLSDYGLEINDILFDNDYAYGGDLDDWWCFRWKTEKVQRTYSKNGTRIIGQHY